MKSLMATSIRSSEQHRKPWNPSSFSSTDEAHLESVGVADLSSALLDAAPHSFDDADGGGCHWSPANSIDRILVGTGVYLEGFRGLGMWDLGVWASRLSVLEFGVREGKLVR